MPKTKFQSVVFTLMMVFCMVYCMTVYTIALGTGSLEYGTFALAIREMWPEFVILFVLMFFLITPAARKLTGKYIAPYVKAPLAVTVATQSFTVAITVPVITLIATFLHNGFTGAWFVQWLTTAAQCWPAAYILQVCIVGPFVRFVFRTLFSRQLRKEQPVSNPA